MQFLRFSILSCTLSCRQVIFLEKMPYVRNVKISSHESPRIMFSNVLGALESNMVRFEKKLWHGLYVLRKKLPKNWLFFEKKFRIFFLKIFDLEIEKKNLPQIFLKTFQHFETAILSIWKHCFNVCRLIFDRFWKWPKSRFCYGVCWVITLRRKFVYLLLWENL